jgi:hypothetical protein
MIIILGALLAFGCSESEPTFEVDPNEVGPVHTDSLLGLSFQPPRDFQAADPAFLQRVRRQMLRTPAAGERFFIVPTMIFALPETDARCFLSEFQNIGAASFDLAWKQSYLEEAESKAAGQTVNSRDIVIAGLDLLEVEIDSPESLNRRYVFQGKDGRFLQIDYLIPTENKKEYLPLLGSSVGSLRLL